MREPGFEVPRREFVAALRQLKIGMRGRRGNAEEVTFTGCEHGVELTVPGATVTLEVTAHWPGSAYCRAAPFLALLRLPPPADPYAVTYREGRLRIGGWSVPARWQDIGPPQVELPINRNDLDVLIATARLSRTELIASGLQKESEMAWKAAEARLAKAAQYLQPLGVSQPDLHKFLQSKLRKMAKQRTRQA